MSHTSDDYEYFEMTGHGDVDPDSLESDVVDISLVMDLADEKLPHGYSLTPEAWDELTQRLKRECGIYIAACIITDLNDPTHPPSVTPKIGDYAAPTLQDLQTYDPIQGGVIP